MKTTILLSALAIVVIGQAGNAQSCFHQTTDLAWGEYFVKATSDSTCFARWGDTMHYYNVRTGTSQFSYQGLQFIPNWFTPPPRVTGVIQYDSILVVSWLYFLRVLKVGFDGKVSEIPSDLDSMPLLKDHIRGMVLRPMEAAKNTFVVNDGYKVFIFTLRGDRIACVDSFQVRERMGQLIGVRGDTLVALLYTSPSVDSVFVYHLNEERKAVLVKVYYSKVPIDLFGTGLVELFYYGDNIYWNELLHEMKVLMKNDTLYDTLRYFYANYAITDIFEYGDGIACVDRDGTIQLLGKGLDITCEYFDPFPGTVLAASKYGNKIFTASAEKGVQTFVPDSIVDLVRDIGAATEARSMTVYPNPCFGNAVSVSTNMHAARFDMMNCLGEIVRRSEFSDDGNAVFATHGLPGGMYFIVARGSEGSAVRTAILAKER